MALLGIQDEGVRLIMVGGKGGVGKTTCASAIALHAAHEGKKVLLLSSDPTPSLSDIFEVDIGSEEREIIAGLSLYGIEISSDLVLKRWKERFGPEIYDVVSSFASVDYDFVDYIGTAPGIEEEYMLHLIVELVESGRYDLVVWDTAPGGHTMRLLKVPELFLKHLEAATKFYMNAYSYFEKVKDALRLRESKKTLLGVIRGWEELSGRISAFIKDPVRTKYVLVTIPEALGLRLTERMVRDFSENGLKVSNIVINHVVKDRDCEFHRQRRAMQDQYMRLIENTYTATNIVRLYLSPREVKGVERIKETARFLFLDGAQIE